MVARFLNRLYAPEAGPPIALSKSRLQLAVGLNYDVFRRYLEFLAQRRLVAVSEATDGPHAVTLTLEGRRAYEKLDRWLRELLGSSDL